MYLSLTNQSIMFTLGLTFNNCFDLNTKRKYCFDVLFIIQRNNFIFFYLLKKP